jgi:hypothetical protein
MRRPTAIASPRYHGRGFQHTKVFCRLHHRSTRPRARSLIRINHPLYGGGTAFADQRNVAEDNLGPNRWRRAIDNEQQCVGVNDTRKKVSRLRPKVAARVTIGERKRQAVARVAENGATQPCRPNREFHGEFAGKYSDQRLRNRARVGKLEGIPCRFQANTAIVRQVRRCYRRLGFDIRPEDLH